LYLHDVNETPVAMALPARKPTDPGALRHIQSLERGMRLLDVIARSRDPLTGVEVADRARINRSTAWRLLATLEQSGMVERDATGRYQTGLELFTLAAASRWGAVMRRARPILEALSADVNETVALAVVQGGGFEVLDQVDGPHALAVRWVGTAMPLLTTSVGKLMLAGMPEREIDSYVQRPIEVRTPRALTDPTHIRAELDEVRRTGLGVSLGDYELGVNGVSAPARDSHGRMLAAVSVTGPDVRLSEDRIREIAPLLRDAATQLETELRHTTPDQGERC
jgi:DNA-binding IclR family transcriptional regulator